MLIKDVFLELRERLRSCNVFITTGVDFNKNCNLKISIQTNCIVLNYYNDDRKRKDSVSSIESLSDCSEDDTEVTSVIPIQEFCQIVPNSMSCLKIDKNTVSFRILTEPKNGGNFYKELLSPKIVPNSSKTSNSLKINIKENTEVKITCANCSNMISNELIKFDRVLELPSENLDMSEWFCHGHCNGNSSQEIVLKPNKNDFLYRLTSFIVNLDHLSGKTNKFNSKREVYHCNRCLAWLGIKNKGTVKLYNSELIFQLADDNIRALTHNVSVKNIATDDFIYTIESMIKEFDLGFQYTVMCKILLECNISASKKQYLLIWVMDKELKVLRNKGKYILNEKIELQSSLLTKILYKVEFSLNNEVESWLSDPSVVSTDISKNMFNFGVEQLKEMSLKVPESFRNANGFFVTYLKV